MAQSKFQEFGQAIIDYVRVQNNHALCPRNLQSVLQAQTSLEDNDHLAVVIRCSDNESVVPFMPYVVKAKKVLVIFPTSYHKEENKGTIESLIDSFGCWANKQSANYIKYNVFCEEAAFIDHYIDLSGNMPNLVFIDHDSFRRACVTEFCKSAVDSFDTVIACDAGCFAEGLYGCSVFTPWQDIYTTFANFAPNEELGQYKKKLIFTLLYKNPVTVYPKVDMQFIEVGVPSYLSIFVQHSSRVTQEEIDPCNIQVSLHDSILV